jgi:hypothetical protein
MRTSILAVVLITLLLVTGAQPAGAEPAVLATWEMNELPGATRMLDASGNQLHGKIGDEVIVGETSDDAIGYRFPWREPNTPPANPGHIVRVPHDPMLNPGDATYTVEVRVRTENRFGNLIQKGQSASRGGYWKIELPSAEPVCLFRGPTGVTNAIRARGRPINDGEWHTVRCVRTTDAVDLYIDDVFMGRNTGLTGAIANERPIYIGGKRSCDQITVTCDYFGGDIDWVRLTVGE